MEKVYRERDNKQSIVYGTSEQGNVTSIYLRTGYVLLLAELQPLLYAVLSKVDCEGTQVGHHARGEENITCDIDVPAQ